ncbi:hypothetical protein [Streptomyces sp. NPDC015125]|uniref:hypothetical protein n=1 Tax=Streptomyces sp. NPDC015125 TaxID=3364938 RepID=UPI0036FA03AC
MEDVDPARLHARLTEILAFYLHSYFKQGNTENRFFAEVIPLGRGVPDVNTHGYQVRLPDGQRFTIVAGEQPRMTTT